MLAATRPGHRSIVSGEKTSEDGQVVGIQLRLDHVTNFAGFDNILGLLRPKRLWRQWWPLFPTNEEVVTRLRYRCGVTLFIRIIRRENGRFVE